MSIISSMPAALPERRPAAVLFDLDGTLADTAPDLCNAANHLRQQDGLPPLPYATLRPHASRGARGMLEVAYGLLPDDDAYPQQLDRFVAHYAQHLCIHSRLFADIDAMLAALATHSQAWAIVTNRKESLARPLVAALGLTATRDCLIGGDTTGLLKPAPEPLLAACAQLEVAPADCLYVGDDIRDVQAAHAAGMPAIAAAWGYLGPDADLASWGANAIAEHPLALLPLFSLARC